MKVTYDARTDTLGIVLEEDTPVSESDEEKPGIVLDYDAQGHLVSIEILGASRHVTEARRVDFEMAE